MSKIRVVHYVNQFFSGIGGEEMATVPPAVLPELPPVSKQLQKQLGDDFEVVGTVVCGDSYFNENAEAKDTIIEMIRGFEPQLVIAGPAFNAGRYGMAAANVAALVEEQLGIHAFSGMYEENPGVDVFRKKVYIVKTSNSAAGMRKALPALAHFAKKYVNDEELNPEEDNFFTKGVRVNEFVSERGSTRAVEMLVKKIKGDEYVTEYPMPEFDRVDANPAVKDITKAKIALVTSGGTVPFGNPDHIESSSATKYGSYSIEGVDSLKMGEWETAHGGFDPTYTNKEPNNVLPVDVLRDLEKEGKIGELYNTFYTTVGNGTAVASSVAFAQEFAETMKADGVDAVILTST